jgi:hypothetical protein
MRVSAPVYTKIMEELQAGKKIAAIKALRRENKPGLKEAKDAIERLQDEQGMNSYPHAVKSGAKLIVGPVIKKLTLDFGDGDVEVDLETMQMITLMQMQKIGLDACGEILDLVATLQAFANGEKIGVIDESR